MFKSCVDIIVKISYLSDKVQKEGILTNLFLEFLENQNKWVKLTAYKKLGEFIISL